MSYFLRTKKVLAKVLNWENLSESKKEFYKNKFTKLKSVILRVLSIFNLHMNTLARIAETDKFGSHNYTPIYHGHFRKFRNKKINILELGVGGEDKIEGGGSLELWQSYFRRAKIVGIDIFDKSHLSRGRIKVFHCSQTDRNKLVEICHLYNGFDIIIDDGSHINEHQIESFNILFKYLKEGGIYVIEDTQTSYWSSYGGGEVGSPEYATSCMQYFKNLVDGLNYKEYKNTEYLPTYFDQNIKSIEFHHNLILIQKSDNNR